MLSDDIVIEIFTFSVLELMKVTENTSATNLKKFFFCRIPEAQLL